MGRLNFLADLFRRNKLVFVFLFISAVAIGGEFFDKINVDNLQLDGNTISTTNTDGNVVVNPNGAGTIELEADTNVTGSLGVTGTVDGRDVSADGAVLDTLNSSLGQITADEADQLENIDTVTISNQQWGFLGALDQALTTVSDVVFATLGIGGNPDSSAVFDVTSTTKGSRPCPSMTEAQRNAISNPAIGLCVINTDTNKYNVYDGTSWTELGSGTGGGLFELKTATSNTKTPSGSGHYHALSGNSLTLTPGTWELSGFVDFSHSGSSPTYGILGAGFFGSNGTDSSSAPNALSSVSGLTVLSAMRSLQQYLEISGVHASIFSLTPIIIRCATTCTVYLVSRANMTTPANARITVYANAKRIQ